MPRGTRKNTPGATTAMSSEWNAHAAIQELAEFEFQPTLNTPYPADVVVNTETGCIVPFASLRVPCRASIRPLLVLEGEEADPEVERRHQEQYHRERCSCKGKYWVPEPDVEKACGRVYRRLPYSVRSTIIYKGNGPRWMKAMFCAALAWAKERQPAKDDSKAYRPS